MATSRILSHYLDGKGVGGQGIHIGKTLRRNLRTFRTKLKGFPLKNWVGYLARIL